MFERFTDRARKVMKLAEQEAERSNHDYICTEHILLGLVDEGSGVAANVLMNLKVDLWSIRLEVEKLIQPGPEIITGEIFLTQKAKTVIELARKESRNLKHPYVGTEHLLLGMLQTQDGIAAKVLMNLGLNCDDVCREVVELLGGDLSDTPPQVAMTKFQVALKDKDWNVALSEARKIQKSLCDLLGSEHPMKDFFDQMIALLEKKASS